MAFPEFLQTGWQDNVRGLLGGVSTTDVPDTLLTLDAYGHASEDRIKELIPDWETEKADPGHLVNLNRAAYRLVAARVCPYLKVKLMQSEKVGSDYSYTLQKVDWDKLAQDLLNQAYENLALVDPAAVGDLNVIEISSRTPPVFEPLTVIDLEDLSGLPVDI